MASGRPPVVAPENGVQFNPGHKVVGFFFFFFFNHRGQLGGERKSDVGEGRGVCTGTSGPRECLSRC